VAGISTTSDSRAEPANRLALRPRSRCHADTASITIPPVTAAASRTCRNPHRNTGLARTAQMLVSCALPLAGLTVKPTGCCIHELAAMTNAADSADPTATSQMVARWIRLGSRFQPNSQSPRKVDSRKKAASPSIASGAPNTSPTNRE
jgi:hypothetical protein